MKTLLYRYTPLCLGCILILFIGMPSAFAQGIITNPSFEAASSSSSVPPPGWSNCSGSPDIQILNGTGAGIFGINTPASNGTTYLGMVTTNGQGWIESLGQACAISAGTPYSGSLDIYRSNGHTTWSGNGTIQFWGGTSCANQAELLWQSPTITNINTWQTHTFTFTPTQNHTFFKIVNFNNTGTGNGHYNCIDNLVMSNILPIELGLFTAEAAYGGSNLNWETGSSLDGQSFEVTWSRDGSATAQFETVATVEGVSGKTTYGYHHKAPVPGDNYYRLKSTDENGAITLSEVRQVQVDDIYAMEVFPNPSAGKLHINTLIDQDSEVQLLVHDLSGRRLFQKEMQLLAGFQTIDLDLADQLSPGLYQITLVQAGERHSQSFSIR